MDREVQVCDAWNDEKGSYCRSPKEKNLEGVADGEIEDEVFAPPVTAAEVNLVDDPAIAFGEPGLADGKGEVEAEDEDGEVEPQTCAHAYGGLA